MKSHVIKLKQGDTCKIDCGTHGENITGPAYIVVLRDEAAAGTTASDEQTMTFGKSKWNDGSKWA